MSKRKKKHLHSIDGEYKASLFVDSKWLENLQMLLLVFKFESITVKKLLSDIWKRMVY